LNQVIKINYKTGKVIGRYGRGKVFHQHDARELDNGNILIFDNGSHRHEYKPEYSRVVELDPKTDEIVWEYQANPPSDFYTAHSGGSERQPNGNTVIIETDKGRAFEVTPDCEIVWEYVNPQYYIDFRGRVTNMVWRFHRYPPNYPGLKGKDLDPERLAWENRLLGPDAFAKDIKACIF
jgi:outer membrane protein assembly factor BamB